MTNTNCLEGYRCPRCGNDQSFRVVATAIFHVTDDGTDFGRRVAWDENSSAWCTQCKWAGTCGELTGAKVQPKPIERDVNDVLRWFDDLCEIAENNPADVEDWIANGADYFDDLKASLERSRHGAA